MSYKKTILIRTRIIFLFILCLATLIVLKITFIQFIQGAKWRKKAEILNLEYRPIKATRGDIYSNDNGLLATSLPFYKIALDPCILDEKTFEKNISNLAEKLSDFFQDKSPYEYEKLIIDARTSKKRYILLNKKKIDYNEKKDMTNWPIFKLGRYKGGVIFEKIEKRFNPFKGMAARTIGHINENNKGAGLEYTFNKELKGTDGEALFQKTIGGWKMLYSTSEMKPVNGYDIETTIDTRMQDIAQSCLNDALIESDADNGCVILMKVDTGEIKAMVNLSRIDENNYYEIYNNAIGKKRDPGSTFKIVSIMALLEKTNIQLEDEIDTGNGTYEWYDKKIKDWNHRSGGFGIITVRDIIERSSNIGISKLIEDTFGHNPLMFVDFIKNLKINEPIGFQMLGEAHPLIKNPNDKSWSGITLSWMSHGYEIEFAPIHILTLYNAIANDGHMVKPIIVKRIRKKNKIYKTYYTKTLKRKICKQKTLDKIKKLLEGVVIRGSSKNIQKGIYQIAGKSGTAQIHSQGKYINSWYVSFVGYFPASNPEYTCLVAIDNPKGYKQYGSDMAAPVLRKIADKIAIYDYKCAKKLKNLDKINNSLPKIIGGNVNDITYLCKQLKIKNKQPKTNLKWVRTKVDESNNITWINNYTGSNNKIPNVCGLTIKDAIYLLEKNKINFSIIGSGNRVKSQSIPVGIKIDNTQILDIELK